MKVIWNTVFLCALHLWEDSLHHPHIEGLFPKIILKLNAIVWIWLNLSVSVWIEKTVIGKCYAINHHPHLTPYRLISINHTRSIQISKIWLQITTRKGGRRWVLRAKQFPHKKVFRFWLHVIRDENLDFIVWREKQRKMKTNWLLRMI